ncbi:MAG TPA: hypothetical protein VIQ05_00960 [Tardiphaga sp.]
MKARAVLIALLVACPAAAQSKPKAAAAPIDPCAPIGRTADGRFVYSLACETLPAPVAPLRADGGAAQSAAPAAVEEEKGGLFRNPFPNLVRPSGDERLSGVGPSTGGR